MTEGAADSDARCFLGPAVPRLMSAGQNQGPDQTAIRGPKRMEGGGDRRLQHGSGRELRSIVILLSLSRPVRPRRGATERRPGGVYGAGDGP